VFVHDCGVTASFAPDMPPMLEHDWVALHVVNLLA
jgi:hypothetical protein